MKRIVALVLGTMLAFLDAAAAGAALGVEDAAAVGGQLHRFQ